MEFYWWRECPSWERALRRLRVAMEELGLDPDRIHVTEVTDEDDAERATFIGSPTIRVDGEDVQPPAAGEPVGLSCRIYRHRDGRITPLPDQDDVRDALRKAIQKETVK